MIFGAGIISGWSTGPSGRACFRAGSVSDEPGRQRIDPPASPDFCGRGIGPREAVRRPPDGFLAAANFVLSECRMANEGVNQGRRRFLTATTAVVGGVGAITAAIPFIKSWQPSARAKNAGAPVLADISKVEVGQRITVAWRGQPVWIIHRSPALLATLPTVESRLRDPNSEVEQ